MASLAQVSDVRTSQSDSSTSPLAYLWRNLDDTALLGILTKASRKVEGIVRSRLVAFTTTETVRFTPDSDDSQILTPWYGGYSTAAAYNCVGFVSTNPPMRPESWTGTLTGISVLGTGNAVTTIDVSTAIFVPSEGRIVLPAAGLGGALLAQVSYTGGYSTVPDDLIEATIYIAADTWLVGTDARDGQMDAQDIWTRAQSELAPWIAAAKGLGIG